MSASGLARERDAGAGGLQRLVLLLGAVLRRLELLARRFDLRLALVVLRLRDDALGEQLLDAGEFRFARARSWRCAFATSGTLLTSKPAVAGWAEPRLDLRGVGLGLLHAALRSRRPTAGSSSAPWLTGVPRSTGVETTRPPVSAATSACSSAVSVPVTRMKRAIGCSVTAAGDTDTASAARLAILGLAVRGAACGAGRGSQEW